MSDLVQLLPPKDGVQIVQLNSPETKNALTLEMRKAISTCFEEAALNGAVNCVVITGGEKCFSAGADVKAVVDYSPTTTRISKSIPVSKRIWGGCTSSVSCSVAYYLFVLAAKNTASELTSMYDTSSSFVIFSHHTPFFLHHIHE